MAGVWKRDGTIAVTKGSKKVVGTGTTFADPKNAAAKGHLLVMVTGTAVDLYEVDYSESNSVFYLVEAYRGDTGTGKAYAIDTSRTDSIPEFARRLNATLGAYQQQGDAFQALLTSDAATIEVTAPDGTKHTMIPWKRVTSEGEGQAARAKVEADKAAASAALAGSIVEASALPLPDVWAPLSDSLRMITGYGRDVLVGSDVVARMANFSRSTTATYIGKDGSLKTAAVNEPRFEKEGLLIEGQSSNLIPWSRGADFSKNPSYFLSGASAVKDGDALIVTATALNGGVGGVLSGTHEGKTTTVSLWAKGAVGGERLRVGLSTDQLAMPFDVVLTTEWVRYSKTYSIGASDTQQTSIRIYAQNPCTFSIDKVQCELLPFASSYIPTAGAAVTRAQDICWIPVENNGLPGLDNEKTVSLTSDIIGIRGPFNFIISTPWGGIDYTATHERVSGNIPVLNMNTPVALKTSVRKAARFTKGGGCSAVFGGIKKDGPTANWSIGTTRITIGSTNESAANPHFGHVKDLKIWLKPLTDEQIKAIA